MPVLFLHRISFNVYRLRVSDLILQFSALKNQERKSPAVCLMLYLLFLNAILII